MDLQDILILLNISSPTQKFSILRKPKWLILKQQKGSSDWDQKPHQYVFLNDTQERNMEINHIIPANFDLNKINQETMCLPCPSCVD